jgi:hypothetical protein
LIQPEVYFNRIEKIRFIQKKLWKIIKANADNPNLQKNCLVELHQSTITLANISELLSAMSGLRQNLLIILLLLVNVCHQEQQRNKKKTLKDVKSNDECHSTLVDE